MVTERQRKQKSAAFFFARITAIKHILSHTYIMLHIQVIRSPESFDFREDKTKPDSFENNWKNNSLDSLVLLRNGAEVFRCRCQSVANYCFGENATASTVPHGDTIAPGYFVMRAFVEPRNFHGEIHAITQTKDYDGEWIDRSAMQTTKGGFQNGRWLIHDRWSRKYGRDTRCAWSAGCIILSSADLERFNTALYFQGVSAGDEIIGEIIESGGEK